MSSNNKNRARHKHALPAEAVRERAEHARSGAAGVHADQQARAYRTGATNRVGSRSSRVRAAIQADER
ncbi:hypothetical protein [Promicromonospora sp. NPDC019610]|uniref:hypothetical protein n=1 Tax=Promicromonospora sp. NPDC019610 TaxID=3364405 RepID=UPI00379954A6